MLAAIAFHWAPSGRRRSIERVGLVPGRRSPAPVFDVDGEWRAPYVCLALDPVYGGALSFEYSGVPGEVWDLWQVWLHPDDDARGRRDGGRHLIEIRVHNRIPKRRVALVASRELRAVRGRPR